jgi:hypothetical protein
MARAVRLTQASFRVPSPSPTPIDPEAEQFESPEPAPQETDDPASQSPSQVSEYYEPPGFPQFDGAFDEKPVGYNRVIPCRNHRLSDLGKGAIGKVKTITANIAKDFPAFKSRGRSKSPELTNEVKPVIIGTQTKIFPFPVQESKKALAEKSPNRRLVPAIVSALKLTSTDFESVQEDSRELLKPETPTQSPTTRGTTPTIPSSEKPFRNVPIHKSGHSSPNTSTETFNGLEYNFGVQRGLEKDIFDRRTFDGLNKRRGASVTPTRSTNEFRHTARKIIVEGNQAEELRNFSNTFKLAKPMPADIATITSRSTSRMDTSEINGGQSNGEHSVPEAVEQSPQVRTPKPKALVKFGRGQKDRFDGLGNCRKATQKKIVERLKEFGRMFQLSTPVPEGIAEILKIDTQEQAREKAAREETNENSGNFSQSLELPEPEIAAMSNVGPAKMEEPGWGSEMEVD